MQIANTDLMGRITTTLVVTNRGAQILAERNVISIEEICSLTLKNVLVDTGANTLCLPAYVISHLGLS